MQQRPLSGLLFMSIVNENDTPVTFPFLPVPSLFPSSLRFLNSSIFLYISEALDQALALSVTTISHMKPVTPSVPLDPLNVSLKKTCVLNWDSASSSFIEYF